MYWGESVVGLTESGTPVGCTTDGPNQQHPLMEGVRLLASSKFTSRVFPGEWKRFMSKVAIDPSTGCWNFTSTNKTTGYGRISWHGRSRDAHAISYLKHHGQVPDGLEIDHLCRNRGCVNPAHLEAVTHRENLARAGAPFSAHAALRARTHCRNGHEYTPGNTKIIAATGRRKCRECLRAKWRRYDQREAVADAR